MSQTLNAGSREILFWKLMFAVLCSVLSQILFLLVFLIITNINILQPAIWFNSTFSSLTSFTTWLFLIPLGSIIFAEGVICSKDYVFETTFRKNRIMKILGIFSFRNLILIFFHILTGILMVWMYLNILGDEYGTIYKNCFKYKYCLVEETFFVLLNGFWIGIFYFIKRYIRNEKNISFPIIQQNKFLTVKLTIIPKLKQAMREAVWPTIYFVGIYYYRGVNLRNWVLELLNLTLEHEPYSLFNMINCYLLFISWMFSTLFIFTMLCMKLFFEVFLTEHWTFPIQSQYSHVLTLKEALAMNKIPIIQHLACMDLYMLAAWDRKRRQVLFTLSQPGGHPHNWNNILQEVLKLVTDFSSQINKATDAILALDTTLSKPKDFDQKPITVIQKPLFSDSTVSIPSSPLMRNMSLPRPEPVDIIQVTKNDFFSNLAQKLKACTIDKAVNLIQTIKQKSGVKYFFGDLPESRIYFLLLKGQPLIWAIQGLSLIVTASFREDEYGIIQNDLPLILSSLVNLKQNLDKLNKVTAISRKSSQSEQCKQQLKVALRTAVKRSLYNICNVFGDYLGHVPITKEIQLQVQNFVSYKEG